MTNAIATDVSINFDCKKVRYQIDCHILHSFISNHSLVNSFIIDNYHQAKVKTKKYLCTNNIKWKIMNLKNVCSKNRTYYCFDGIIK